jgi:hypothetical protein
MKKFKHKKLGWVAEFDKNAPQDENPYYYLKGNVYLPKELIENSEDWEENNVPILTTEDGVELFEGDICIIINTKDLSYLTECSVRKHFKKVDFYKYFSKIENAEEYVLMNSKLLSLQDLIDAAGHDYIKTSIMFKKYKQKAIKNKEA